VTVKAEATLDDLLTDAAKAGQPMTRRVLTAWIQLGLLDHPARRGKGRAKGSHPATVTPDQRQLFALLLRHRSTVKRLSTLAALPVTIWVYWGDDYVPLRQAKRALGTCLGKARHPAKHYAQRVAQDVVDQLAHPDAPPTAKRKLLRLLTEAAYEGRITYRADLRATLRAVFDPHAENRRIGPAGIGIDADAWLNAVLLREQGTLAFLRGRINDDMFQEARHELRQSLTDYQLLQAGFASSLTETGTQDASDLVNSACPNLLMVIGSLQRRQQENHV